MILTRQQLLGMTSRRFREVPIPDGIELADGTKTNGLTFRIRSLTEKEMATIETSGIRVNKTSDKILLSESELQRQRRRMLLAVLVDDNGNTLLTPDDDEALTQLDGMIAQIIYAEALEWCGMKDARDSEKNSKGTRVADVTGS